MIDPFFNHQLGIHILDLPNNWEQYDIEKQQHILFHWEQIRGTIPDRIVELEQEINHKQAQLSNESNSPSCQLNTEIAELASIINDLWLWYRPIRFFLRNDDIINKLPFDGSLLFIDLYYLTVIKTIYFDKSEYKKSYLIAQVSLSNYLSISLAILTLAISLFILIPNEPLNLCSLLVNSLSETIN